MSDGDNTNCHGCILGCHLRLIEPRHEKTCLREFPFMSDKLACSATEASMRLEILVTETRDITLSRQRTTKALIRLRGCAG